MMSETVAAQSSTVAKSSSIVVIAGGSGVRHTDGRDESDRPLGADHHPTEVAGRLRSLGAEASHGPVPEHHVERQDVRGRDAVRQAVRATRAFVPTFPPIDDTCCEDGSGMYVNPVPRRATPRSRLNRPGSTHASRSSGLISRMRSIFDVTTTRASPIGVDAPASPVPLLEDHRQVVHRGRADARGDVVGGTREDHETGRALDHRRIACVEAERQGVRQHLVRTERSLELRRAASRSATSLG